MDLPLRPLPHLSSPVSDHDPRAALVTQMITDLGWCTAAYGRIEWLFGDIVWRALEDPAYAHLIGKGFPVMPASRLSRLKDILAAPGPLETFADDLLLLVRRLEELQHSRHLFTHGHSLFAYTASGQAALQFRRFVPPPSGSKGQKVTRFEANVSPAALRNARTVWSIYSGTAMIIIAEAYEDLGWPMP